MIVSIRIVDTIHKALTTEPSKGYIAIIILVVIMIKFFLFLFIFKCYV